MVFLQPSNGFQILTTFGQLELKDFQSMKDKN